MQKRKKQKVWHYDHVTLLEVKDGDTVKLKIDFGFYQFTERDFRLIGIDAPECKGATKAAGDAATMYLTGLLIGGIKNITTYGPDKYGRELAKIVSISTDGSDVDVAYQMMKAGHAVPYYGGKR